MIIKQIYIAILNFPTDHYISGWRPDVQINIIKHFEISYEKREHWNNNNKQNKKKKLLR
jgi:hypothetical protein